MASNSGVNDMVKKMCLSFSERTCTRTPLLLAASMRASLESISSRTILSRMSSILVPAEQLNIRRNSSKCWYTKSSTRSVPSADFRS